MMVGIALKKGYAVKCRETYFYTRMKWLKGM